MTTVTHVIILVAFAVFAVALVAQKREIDRLRSIVESDGQPDLHWQLKFNELAEAHRALRVACGKERP